MKTVLLWIIIVNSAAFAIGLIAFLAWRTLYRPSRSRWRRVLLLLNCWGGASAISGGIIIWLVLKNPKGIDCIKMGAVLLLMTLFAHLLVNQIRKEGEEGNSKSV